MHNNRYNLSETDTTSRRTMTALSHLKEEVGAGQRRQKETFSDNASVGNRWGRDIKVTVGINRSVGNNNSPQQGNTRSMFTKHSGKIYILDSYLVW